ncbi:MAG: hypothetical protein LBT59_05225 [Clostridiales bacterium]|jgi:hypothetical protein|nr:hypothetical protein [Clostridiales bacterium]
MNVKLKKPLSLIKESMFEDTCLLGCIVAFSDPPDNWLENSIFYKLFTNDFLPMPQDGGRWLIGLEPFYVLAEIGGEGFKTSLELSFCEVELVRDTVIINPSPASPEDFEKAKDIYWKEYDSLSDEFAKNAIMSEEKAISTYGRIIKACSDTKFLRTADSSLVKHAVQLQSDGFSLPKGRHVLASSGRPIDENANVGDLMQDGCQIGRIVEIAHDYEANFYALVEALYTYPKDVSAMRARFPDFDRLGLDREASKKKFLKNCEFMARIKMGKLGDKIVCQKLIERYPAYAIENSIFQFSLDPSENRLTVSGELVIGVSKQERELNVLATCISVDEKLNLIMYEFRSFIECQGEYFACFSFLEESGFFSLDKGVKGENWSAPMFLIQSYVERGMVSPVKVLPEEYWAWPVKHVEDEGKKAKK